MPPGPVVLDRDSFHGGSVAGQVLFLLLNDQEG